MTTPTPADPVAALVAILAADSAIATFAEGRVFGGELPEAETASMPRPAIVLKASGGIAMMAGSYVETDTMRIDAYAYGARPKVAAGLMALVAAVLRRVSRVTAANTLIHWVQPAGGFSSGREPETEWPRAWQSFQVLYALNAVS